MKGVNLIRELKHHLPFSILSVCFALMTMGVLNFITSAIKIEDTSGPSIFLFHIFHPIHLLFSAIATTAMFWQNEKNFFKAILIGFAGSVVVCGASDIIIPYISGLLLGVQMHFHICIVEHPSIILPFVILGIIAGFFAPGTLEKHEGVIFSHSLHVFTSSMASILYLIGYGLNDWIGRIGVVLVYTVIAVIIPCCTSDIVFPLVLVDKERKIQHPVDSFSKH
ncbi:MAG: hypothetical protein NC831_03700 [Candidatus Omnitrophica bacterium]|nr:hypothetical protein [Candidatus Omnitrophota bacterium]MCM8828929.1 hypothetical protein [Candidatus Omnitrophota bacterium]